MKSSQGEVVYMEVSMSKVKGLLMTAELYSMKLNDRGWTNEQTLAFIKKELGQMATTTLKVFWKIGTNLITITMKGR